MAESNCDRFAATGESGEENLTRISSTCLPEYPINSLVRHSSCSSGSSRRQTLNALRMVSEQLILLVSSCFFNCSRYADINCTNCFLSEPSNGSLQPSSNDT